MVLTPFAPAFLEIALRRNCGASTFNAPVNAEAINSGTVSVGKSANLTSGAV